VRAGIARLGSMQGNPAGDGPKQRALTLTEPLALADRMRAQGRERGLGRPALWAIVAALLYFGSAKLGLALAFATPSVTAIWPPTGIALAALLLGGLRLWPGVALGAFLANVTTDVPLATTMGITLGNTLEAVVGASLLTWFGFRPDLRRLRDIFGLVVLAGIVSTTISATIGVASLNLWDAPSQNLWTDWRVWWLGDMGGDLLVASFLLVAVTHWPYREAPGRGVEALVLACGLVAVGLVVFSQSAGTAYAIFPLLIWAALRFLQPGATAAGLVIATIAVVYTADGSGQFVQPSEDDSLLLAQTFSAVCGLTALVLATVTAQRTRAERRTRQIADALQGELLPPTLAEIPGIEVAAWYRPGRREQEVGGDFYDLFAAEPEGWVAVIGDVCGNGPEAASLTALARYTLRSVAGQRISPSETLALLNKAILDQRTDQRFMTAALMRLVADGHGYRVSVSNGGHPCPLVLRADGRVEEIGTAGTLLGIWADPRLEDDHLRLGPGDALVLFTDGLSDGRDPADEPVGQIREALSGIAGATADEICTSLKRVALASDDRPADDVAVLVLTAEAAGRRERDHHSISVALEPTPDSAATARAAVAPLADELGPEVQNDLRLLVTELVTNCVRHAGLTGTERIQLRVLVKADTLRVEVGDPGGGFEPRVAQPGPHQVGGWGLYIVDRLADRWGIQPEGNGTAVWLEKDLSGADLA
jgi:integral membrane sensor domain MASE1/anti-sigma regulatory factor (Ser/Thr protein kinase)